MSCSKPSVFSELERNCLVGASVRCCQPSTVEMTMLSAALLKLSLARCHGSSGIGAFSSLYSNSCTLDNFPSSSCFIPASCMVFGLCPSRCRVPDLAPPATPLATNDRSFPLLRQPALHARQLIACLPTEISSMFTAGKNTGTQTGEYSDSHGLNLGPHLGIVLDNL